MGCRSGGRDDSPCAEFAMIQSRNRGQKEMIDIDIDIARCTPCRISQAAAGDQG